MPACGREYDGGAHLFVRAAVVGGAALVAVPVPRFRRVALWKELASCRLRWLSRALTAVFPPIRLVLGTTFVTAGLLAYAIGGVVAALVDR